MQLVIHALGGGHAHTRTHAHTHAHTHTHTHTHTYTHPHRSDFKKPDMPGLANNNLQLCIAVV